jgi:2-aminoethylphosphonate-pyruvate transaminase
MTDKRLFTPGPLTTSLSVKRAMLRDLGSRDDEFIQMVARIRDALLELGGVSRETGYECVLMQGSGTFGLEALVSSALPENARFLVLVNGAYGERIAEMAALHGVDTEVLRTPENTPPAPAQVAEAITRIRATHLMMVHCETTTGILNPVQEVGRVTTEHGVSYFVDSMSALGALPVDLAAWGIDYLVSSSNKCIEGVPGFSFVLCRRDALLGTQGLARTMSLDLHAQWQGLEANGQFRFTPPTHVLLAFHQALQELQEEGGPAGRCARYRSNQRLLVDGMRGLGFTTYLAPEVQGPIITTFHEPADDAFDFELFARRLSDRDCVIYPGKLSQAACFRVGTVGRLQAEDIAALLAAIPPVLHEMGVTLSG